MAKFTASNFELSNDPSLRLSLKASPAFYVAEKAVQSRIVNTNTASKTFPVVLGTFPLHIKLIHRVCGSSDG